MCLAIPGQIVGVREDVPDLAVAEVGGVRRPINVGLLGDRAVAAGDWVLIHVGFAISKVDEAEAGATIALLEGLGQPYEDELRAFEAAADADRAGGGNGGGGG